MNILTKFFAWLRDSGAGKKTKTAVVVTTVAVSASYFDPGVLDAIKRYEGFRAKPYTDVVGVRTIGYGHTNAAGGKRISPNDIWTKKHASSMLEKDLQQYWDGVGKYVTVPLNRCQQSVLTSWTYNVGVGAMRKSTLVKVLNLGHYKDVPRLLMSWNKGRINGKLVAIKGLTNRRADEGRMWRKCTK